MKLTKSIIMKKLLLLTTSLLVFSVFGQVDRSKQPTPGPAPTIQVKEPQQYKLKNGLTVMFVENRKLPIISAKLTEANNQHLVQHLRYKLKSHSNTN